MEPMGHSQVQLHYSDLGQIMGIEDYQIRRGPRAISNNVEPDEEAPEMDAADPSMLTTKSDGVAVVVESVSWWLWITFVPSVKVDAVTNVRSVVSFQGLH